MTNITYNTLIYLCVFIGGGMGAASRYFVSTQMAKLLGNHFPYGTLSINILGSLLMGIVAGYFSPTGNEQHQALRLFLTVGFLGGFTTFSSFSIETISLWQSGQLLHAGSYILLSVVVSLVAALCGFALVKTAIS